MRRGKGRKKKQLVYTEDITGVERARKAKKKEVIVKKYMSGKWTDKGIGNILIRELELENE